MTHEETPRRGRLKVFLGYAAGVGKTFRMLEEAHERRRQGADVVIGYFEPHGRADTIAEAAGLEAVPRRKIEYRGVMFEEMDADAVLARNAAVCLVDELAHTNVPGSRHAKRWEDVLELLQAGIEVWTTVNVQHIESLNDQVRQITGVSVRETLPDWVIQQADEVVMVDATPMALLNRLRRGVVYPTEKARRAMENFFQRHADPPRPPHRRCPSGRLLRRACLRARGPDPSRGPATAGHRAISQLRAQLAHRDPPAGSG
jgi:two-component system sensor histidine kinase KdpD